MIIRSSTPFQQYAPEDLLGPLNEVERKNAPPRLFALGDLSLLRSGPRVSIVGARNASPEGCRRARKLATELAREGVIVVSGLAEGIDTAAHEGAISAGGRTIAVLGAPLDVSYPQRNEALRQSILREHLAISQFPSGHPILRQNFPRRNRCMALVSDATVIVEAGDTSGSLSQGWEAIRLGRLLFIMKSVTVASGLTWPREMLRYGAQILTDTRPLLRLLPQEADAGLASVAF